MNSKTETVSSMPFSSVCGSSEEASVVGREDWSFGSLKPSETLWGPHGYHRYPAKFIPQLVRRIIDRYSGPGDLVGDSFVGSATTGVEALRSGRRFWGSDINPVALLISQAKCRPLPPDDLSKNWGRLLGRLKLIKRVGRRPLTDQERAEILAIDIARAADEERLRYWFPQAYRDVLAEIFVEIMSGADESTRTFYLCGFSNILRRSSIWLSGSTKPQKDLQKNIADPVEELQKQIRDMLRRNSLYWQDLVQSGIDPDTLEGRWALEQADARHLPLQPTALDLLVTSPPYATCYEYAELHQLTSLWLSHYHVFPQKARDVSAYIGTRGGGRREERFSSTDGWLPSSAQQALEQLATKANGGRAADVMREVTHLTRYFFDMYEALCEARRVLVDGKLMVLIIGNSRRRGVIIPTSSAVSEMACNVGFELEQRLVREIPGRILVSTRDLITGRFSSRPQSDGQAYAEEDILVLRKCVQ